MLPAAPRLAWSPEGCPEDLDTGDVFFSRDGGLAEAEAVFLAGCGLPQRWAGRDRFAIGELGFGSGLNALAAWRLWRQTRPAGATLHFTSIEARPWAAAEAARAHAAFPEIASLSARLLARWPVRAAGPQRLWFPEDGFCLTVWHGEAGAILPRLHGMFDAWFLDGFAPAKNPELWSQPVFTELQRLCAPDARLATYTVAASVRAHLEAAGFAWAKRPGFGKKRERLEAWPVRAAPGPPSLFPSGARAGRIAILGGGAAGASLAQALTRRGRRPLLLEAGAELAGGASGNPAALVMPRLDRGDTPAARFFLAAYLFALQHYGAEEPSFHPCGVRQPTAAERLQALAADPLLPPDWLEFGPEALRHPKAGVLAPAAVVARWAAGAELCCGAQAARLERTGEAWRILDAGGALLAEAETLVLANGPGLASFEETAWLPLQLSRGQIELAAGVAAPEAVADGTYAAPCPTGLVFGATFDAVEHAGAVAPEAASRAENLAALARLAPELAAAIDPARLVSRAALRAATPDRLPIAGQAPDAPSWRISKGGQIAGEGQALPGLYLLGGFGARGFLVAPLLAERLAAEICGEPSPLDAGVLEALHPARFLLRALKRGRAGMR